MVARISRLRRYITLRIWPLLAGFGSAMVMVLAFFIPSIQDQWDRYQSRKVIEQYEQLGDRFLAEDRYRMAEAAYDKALELSEGKRLDIEVKRLDARVGLMGDVTNWGDSVPGDLEEVDFQFLLHLRQAKDVRRALVLNAYGVYLASTGRTRDAEAAYAEAIALQPMNALLRVNHGNLLDQVGKKQEAGLEYREARKLDPTDAQAHYDLGLWYLEQDSMTLAGQELREAAKLAPDDTAAAARLRELQDTTAR